MAAGAGLCYEAAAGRNGGYDYNRPARYPQAGAGFRLPVQVSNQRAGDSAEPAILEYSIYYYDPRRATKIHEGADFVRIASCAFVALGGFSPDAYRPRWIA